jgi:hypothetical protein
MVRGETLREMRAAEMAALRSAALASDTCERAGGDRVHDWSAEVAAPLRGGVPETPLLRAVEDLGSTAYAAARALHFSTIAGSQPEVARLATDVAVATAQAVDLAVKAAAHRTDVTGLWLRVDLAHACAGITHRVADALDAGAPPRPLAGAAGGRSPVPFPPSWRRLTALLSQAIRTPARREDEPVTDTPHAGPAVGVRLDAARAARDAAERAMRSYDRCRVTSATMRLLCRCARRAARATTHAGFAALGPAG